MRPLLPALLLLAACSSPPPPVRRAPPAPPKEEGLSFPPNVPRPELTLTPGDLVRISVFQQPDLDLETRIPDDGRISFPLIGPVQAAGVRSPDLEKSIRDRLAKDYLQSPSVTVQVKEYVKRKVFIVGGVAKPDGYELAPDARLTVLQLIAAAGGFTDRASRDVVQVLRRQPAGGRILLLLPLAEVDRRLAAGRADADLDLWPDDLVVVPASVRVAYVLGAVQRPGAVEIPANTRMTVSMAVSYAGSYTKFASTGGIQVLRRSASGAAQHYTVDLDAVLDGRLDLDLVIQAGDVVWVPERGIF